MYLRWHSRQRRIPAFGGWGKQIRRGSNYVYTRKGTSKQDMHWAAVLVESVRIAGKPTQRHVAYLGGITDSAIAVVHQRCWFWDGVLEQLDRLGMSSENRKRIEAAVATKVPRPTKAQYNQCVRDRAALWRRT
jgi:hypothetical protein